MSDDSTLRRHRDAIDALDLEILARLSERARHAQAIGRLKEGSGGPAYRPEREAQVLARLAKANGGPLAGEAVACVFREIMSACRALERALTIAYLGPQGTFTHAAVLQHFGSSVVALPQFVVPPPAAIGAGVAMALVWSAAQWLSVHAYHRGDAAVLAPFSYTQLLWSTLIGVAIFRHVPDGATLAGIGTILVCGVVAAWWSTRDAAGPARPG